MPTVAHKLSLTSGGTAKNNTSFQKLQKVQGKTSENLDNFSTYSGNSVLANLPPNEVQAEIRAATNRLDESKHSIDDSLTLIKLRVRDIVNSYQEDLMLRVQSESERRERRQAEVYDETLNFNVTYGDKNFTYLEPKFNVILPEVAEAISRLTDPGDKENAQLLRRLLNDHRRMLIHNHFVKKQVIQPLQDVRLWMKELNMDTVSDGDIQESLQQAHKDTLEQLTQAAELQELLGRLQVGLGIASQKERLRLNFKEKAVLRTEWNLMHHDMPKDKKRLAAASVPQLQEELTGMIEAIAGLDGEDAKLDQEIKELERSEAVLNMALEPEKKSMESKDGPQQNPGGPTIAALAEIFDGMDPIYVYAAPLLEAALKESAAIQQMHIDCEKVTKLINMASPKSSFDPNVSAYDSPIAQRTQNKACLEKLAQVLEELRDYLKETEPELEQAVDRAQAELKTLEHRLTAEDVSGLEAVITKCRALTRSSQDYFKISSNVFSCGTKLLNICSKLTNTVRANHLERVLAEKRLLELMLHYTYKCGPQLTATVEKRREAAFDTSGRTSKKK